MTPPDPSPRASSDPPSQPLEYANAYVGPPSQNGWLLAVAIVCQIVGGVVAALLLALTARYHDYSDFDSTKSLWFAGGGMGICLLGYWLARRKPAANRRNGDTPHVTDQK